MHGEHQMPCGNTSQNKILLVLVLSVTYVSVAVRVAWTSCLEGIFYFSIAIKNAPTLSPLHGAIRVMPISNLSLMRHTVCRKC